MENSVKFNPLKFSISSKDNILTTYIRYGQIGLSVPHLNPGSYIGVHPPSYEDGVNRAKKYLINQKVPQPLVDELAKQALNLPGVESQYGSSISYKALHFIPDWAIGLAKSLKRGKSSANSRGLTQIKYNPADEDIYKPFGITDSNLAQDFNNGTAALMRLWKIQRDQIGNRKFTWKDGTPVSNEDVRAVIWNRGRFTSGVNDKNDFNGRTPARYVRTYHQRSRYT